MRAEDGRVCLRHQLQGGRYSLLKCITVPVLLHLMSFFSIYSLPHAAVQPHNTRKSYCTLWESRVKEILMVFVSITGKTLWWSYCFTNEHLFFFCWGFLHWRDHAGDLMAWIIEYNSMQTSLRTDTFSWFKLENCKKKNQREKQCLQHRSMIKMDLKKLLSVAIQTYENYCTAAHYSLLSVHF